MRLTVARLRGCLGGLPERQRVVLELRTGVNARHTLGIDALAGYLHIKPAEVISLEGRALRGLRVAARAGSCLGAGPVASGASAFAVSTAAASGVAGGSGGGSGGVASVRYLKSASTTRTGSQGSSPLSSAAVQIEDVVRSVPSEVWLLIVLLLTPALLLGALYGDWLAPAARARWRYRFMRRPPWR